MHRADLHIHTTASDGVYTPSKVVLRAKEKGVNFLAITDHDCIAGIDEACQYAKLHDIRVISGVELSTGNNAETHVLGYGVNQTDPRLNAFLKQMREDRKERAQKICEKLIALQMPVSLPNEYLAGDKALGRPQIARAMMERGYVGSVQEAFEKYLGSNCPAYVPRKKVETLQAIRLLREIGAVPVLAHPCQIHMSENALAKEFSKWLDAGLMGIEIYHPSMSPAYRLKWKQIANQYHLVITGGSDFHAPGDKHADIGEMINAWNTCNEDVERLMEAVQMVKGN